MCPIPIVPRHLVIGRLHFCVNVCLVKALVHDQLMAKHAEHSVAGTIRQEKSVCKLAWQLELSIL